MPLSSKKKRFLWHVVLAFSAACMWACGGGSDGDSSNTGTETKPGTEIKPGDDSGGSTTPGKDEDPGTDKPPADDDDKPDADADACKNIDLMTSAQNCGSCGHACGDFEACVGGKCECAEGNSDCDGDGICDTEGECVCHPGDTLECYQGTPETMNVGACRSGVWQCEKTVSGKFGWGNTCVGQVMPSFDYICDPTQPDLDVDCNGHPDATQDDDGDGYTICNPAGDAIWDCCDNYNMCQTTRPDLIHPGRTECDGNGIDDNCDGKIDDSGILCSENTQIVESDCKIKERSCSQLANWTYGNQDNVSMAGALEMAKALDACLDVVTKDSGLPGLIEYSITAASDYNIGLNAMQINVKDGMYASDGVKKIFPRAGDTFVILSSGVAGDAKTELAQLGTDDKRSSLGGTIPEPYRTAHENQLQTHPSCPTGGADIYDAVRLHLQIRAPENAKGFSFDFRFFSREYPYYVCSKYNDFFLTLLTDEAGKPLEGVNPDGNISFDKDGNPVSVNNAFFTTCANAPCNGIYEKPVNGQCPAMLACSAVNPEETDPSLQTMACGGNMCKDGADALSAYYPEYYSSMDDDPATKRGGATAWLTTQAPVKGGEIFNLDFYIWDTGDLRFDSSVILDNFQWKCTETQVGTDFATGGEVVN